MDSCPNCGYCKHCGRSAQPWYQQPPFYVRPWYNPTTIGYYQPTTITTYGEANAVPWSFTSAQPTQNT